MNYLIARSYLMRSSFFLSSMGQAPRAASGVKHHVMHHPSNPLGAVGHRASEKAGQKMADAASQLLARPRGTRPRPPGNTHSRMKDELMSRMIFEGANASTCEHHDGHGRSPTIGLTTLGKLSFRLVYLQSIENRLLMI